MTVIKVIFSKLFQLSRLFMDFPHLEACARIAPGMEKNLSFLLMSAGDREKGSKKISNRRIRKNQVG